MEETQIGSIRTLLDKVESFSAPTYTFYYRGHANKKYNPLPSLYRKENWYSNEHLMVREMIARCPQEFYSLSSSFEKLVKMQHYNLPTRLLDITSNPLIALFFACSSKRNIGKDGELLIYKVPKTDIKQFDSDTASILSNLAWVGYDFEIHKRFSQSSKSFHHDDNIHAEKLLHTIKDEKAHFINKIDPHDLSKVLCIRPKLDNPRIIKQDGAFFLFGINKTKQNPAEIDKSWFHFPEKKRYIIKSSDKRKILKQLSSIGISAAKLFPEIDNVANYLKSEFFSEKEPFESTLAESKYLSMPKFKVL